MMEFEEKFLPESSNKQLSEMNVDSHNFGVSLAKESLEMVKRQISKSGKK